MELQCRAQWPIIMSPFKCWRYPPTHMYMHIMGMPPFILAYFIHMLCPCASIHTKIQTEKDRQTDRWIDLDEKHFIHISIFLLLLFYWPHMLSSNRNKYFMLNTGFHIWTLLLILPESILACLRAAHSSIRSFGIPSATALAIPPISSISLMS